MGSLVVSRSAIPQHTRRPCPVLLLDASGSMGEGQPERRIDLLWKAVKAIRTPQSMWRTAVFNHHCRWASLEQVPLPQGTTDLTSALGMIKGACPTVVTLVTDGEPDDDETALAAAVALECPINILYVGDPDATDAINFCRLVCERTKGTFATEVLTLQNVQTLANTMKKMLVTDTTARTVVAMGGHA
jgi:hypothetical protein